MHNHVDRKATVLAEEMFEFAKFPHFTKWSCRGAANICMYLH